MGLNSHPLISLPYLHVIRHSVSVTDTSLVAAFQKGALPYALLPGWAPFRTTVMQTPLKYWGFFFIRFPSGHHRDTLNHRFHKTSGVVSRTGQVLVLFKFHKKYQGELAIQELGEKVCVIIYTYRSFVCEAGLLSLSEAHSSQAYNHTESYSVATHASWCFSLALSLD